MSLRQAILSGIWNDVSLAGFLASSLLSGLLWRLGDAAGARIALFVTAACLLAILATAVTHSISRHLTDDTAGPVPNPNPAGAARRP